MRYGFYLPTRGGCATPEALETIVQRGEALGFHSVKLGVSELVFDFRSDHLAETLERMEHFGQTTKSAGLTP